MKKTAALTTGPLAPLAVSVLCLCSLWTEGQSAAAEPAFPADLDEVSLAAPPPLNVGALYMMSEWPNLPPMPAPVTFGPAQRGGAGPRPLLWADVPTNCAIYFSPSLGAVFIDDREAVAARMLAESTSELPPLPGEDDPPGGASGGGGGISQWAYTTNQFWLEPLCVASNLFYATLHGTTNGATYIISSTEELSPLSNRTWLVEGSLQGGPDDAT
jgi:hypothetical protein